jgi:hypothetical protein
MTVNVACNNTTILAYPNPAQNNIYVSTQGVLAQSKATVYIKNNLGQIVLQQQYMVENNADVKVDISGLAASNYILEFKTEDKHLVQKFTKN